MNEARIYGSKNLHKHTYPGRLYQAMLSRFENKLLGLLARTKATSVLDAGCGEGFVLKGICDQPAGYKAVGVDISRGALRYARGLCPADTPLLLADLNHLPFRTASFDAVVCSEVLEHLQAVAPVLEELKRVSRGYVLLSVPREPYFRVLAWAAEQLGLGEDPDHLHFWSRRALAGLLSRHFGATCIRTYALYRLALCGVCDTHARP